MKTTKSCPQRIINQNAVGWFDLGIKIIFGTIDQFEKRSLKKKIKFIKENSKENTKFNFKFSKLIEQTVSQLNDSVEIINHHEDILKSMKEVIEILKNNERSYDYELQSGIVFAGLATRFNEITKV